MQYTEVTSEGAHISTPTTPTTIATDGVEVTTSSTSTNAAITHGDTTNVVDDSRTTETNGITHGDTTNVVDDSRTTETNGNTEATTVEMTTSSKITMEMTTTKNPEHPLGTTSLSPADFEAAELDWESDHMPVAYASLAISLVSLTATVTLYVLILLFFCKIWKKISNKGTYSLSGERQMNFNENEYSFAVDEKRKI